MKRTSNVHRSPITDDLSQPSGSSGTVSYLITLAVTFAVLCVGAAILVLAVGDPSVPAAQRVASVPVVYIFGASLIFSAFIHAMISAFRTRRK